MKIYLPILLLLVACSHSSQQKPRPKAAAAATPVLSKAPLNYDSCKAVVIHTRRSHRADWSRIPRIEKEKIFTDAIISNIIPAWVGTSWSFNGTSEKPREGSIACGYFVTTVLRDAGVSLARTKLAQCASEQMIRSLVQPAHVQRFSNLPMEIFIRSVQDQGYGLYIVGLDNHTGFIYNDGKSIFFIHSTFVGTRNVQYEPAAESWVLRQSRYKVLGKLSADEGILSAWVN